MMKTDSLLQAVNSSVVDLPAPGNLWLWWNYGSLVGLSLMVQLMTGFILSMHFSGSVLLSFDSIVHIIRDVSYGWWMRTLHANGASMFFLGIFLHITRGLYFGSFKNKKTWNTGVVLFLLSMGTAFVGYVLPWGQMSFWGATVITNLISAIPYFGGTMVEWVWGGFSVENPTLIRFFSFHFILPLGMSAIALLHMILLHETGSNNPLGVNSSVDKVSFHPLYSSKDSLGFILQTWLVLAVVSLFPYFLSDPENFSPANPLVTPVHIQPEWYFLFAYAILRAVPNKVGGVIALLFSVIILSPYGMVKESLYSSISFYPLSKIWFFILVLSFLILTWIGMSSVEPPFVFWGVVGSCLYFFSFFFMKSFSYLQDTLFKII